mmetsp:Transcript_9464/g.16321  ORF Transcript_9464/g.16321 Transcript_9464/m.16321 type:complete len:131 (-) Transcript_9464:148-540(-)
MVYRREVERLYGILRDMLQKADEERRLSGYHFETFQNSFLTLQKNAEEDRKLMTLSIQKLAEAQEDIRRNQDDIRRNQEDLRRNQEDIRRNQENITGLLDLYRATQPSLPQQNQSPPAPLQSPRTSRPMA